MTHAELESHGFLVKKISLNGMKQGCYDKKPFWTQINVFESMLEPLLSVDPLKN